MSVFEFDGFQFELANHEKKVRQEKEKRISTTWCCSVVSLS